MSAHPEEETERMNAHDSVTPAAAAAAAGEPQSGVAVLQVSSTTWNRDSHELFDYESQHVFRKKYLVKVPAKVFRNNLDVTLYPEGSPLPNYGDYLLAVKNRDSRFYISPADKNTSGPNSQLQPKKLWLIIKHLRGGSFSLSEFDIIKLGRFKLKVKQICIEPAENGQIDFKLDEGEIPVTDLAPEDSGLMQCRICLLEGGTSDDPLVRPCQCKGSIMYVHVKCLRRWVENRLNLGDDPNRPCYFVKQLQCELCKTFLPSAVRIGGSRIPIVKLPHIQPPLIVLENLVGPANKGYHICSMAARKECKLGRGHDSDVRIADVSISRFHAMIKYCDGQFTLEDHTSKFGTLVALRKPTMIEGPEILAVQVGRTVMEFLVDQIMPGRPGGPGGTHLLLADIEEIQEKTDTGGGEPGGPETTSDPDDFNAGAGGAGGGAGAGGGGERGTAPHDNNNMNNNNNLAAPPPPQQQQQQLPPATHRDTAGLNPEVLGRPLVVGSAGVLQHPHHQHLPPVSGSSSCPPDEPMNSPNSNTRGYGGVAVAGVNTSAFSGDRGNYDLSNNDQLPIGIAGYSLFGAMGRPSAAVLFQQQQQQQQHPGNGGGGNMMIPGYFGPVFAASRDPSIAAMTDSPAVNPRVGMMVDEHSSPVQLQNGERAGGLSLQPLHMLSRLEAPERSCVDQPTGRPYASSVAAGASNSFAGPDDFPQNSLRSQQAAISQYFRSSIVNPSSFEPALLSSSANDTLGAHTSTLGAHTSTLGAHNNRMLVSEFAPPTQQINNNSPSPGGTTTRPVPKEPSRMTDDPRTQQAEETATTTELQRFLQQQQQFLNSNPSSINNSLSSPNPAIGNHAQLGWPGISNERIMTNSSAMNIDPSRRDVNSNLAEELLFRTSPSPTHPPSTFLLRAVTTTTVNTAVDIGQPSSSSTTSQPLCPVSRLNEFPVVDSNQRSPPVYLDDPAAVVVANNVRHHHLDARETQNAAVRNVSSSSPPGQGWNNNIAPQPQPQSNNSSQ